MPAVKPIVFAIFGVRKKLATLPARIAIRINPYAKEILSLNQNAKTLSWTTEIEKLKLILKEHFLMSINGICTV